MCYQYGKPRRKVLINTSQNTDWTIDQHGEVEGNRGLCISGLTGRFRILSLSHPHGLSICAQGPICPLLHNRSSLFSMFARGYTTQLYGDL